MRLVMNILLNNRDETEFETYLDCSMQHLSNSNHKAAVLWNSIVTLDRKSVV
jgi:hypothetical protein